MEMDRRSLLGGVALTGVAAATTWTGLAFADEQQVDDASMTWDYEADVVVVGVGCSGIAVACEASSLLVIPFL